MNFSVLAASEVHTNAGNVGLLSAQGIDQVGIGVERECFVATFCELIADELATF